MNFGLRQKFSLLAFLAGGLFAVMSVIGYYTSFLNLSETLTSEILAIVDSQGKEMDSWLKSKAVAAQYCADLLRVLSVGGILFADNVLYRGYVGKNKTAPHKHATIKHGMEKFLETVTGAENLKTVVYELEDGVSVTEKLYD